MSDDRGPLTPIPQKFLNRTEEKLAVISTVLQEMKPQVGETNKAVVELKTEMKGMGTRLTKVEDKVDRGHGCLNVDVIAELKTNDREQSQKIETDIQKGIERGAVIKGLTKEAASLEADVEDIKKAPRRMLYGLLGIIITLVGGAGTIVWFLSGLNTEVRFEREQRTEQFKMVKAQIEAVGDVADVAPVRADISELNKAVKVSNGHEEEYNEICLEMPRYMKRFVKTEFLKKGKRIPMSCLEEE